MARLAGIHGLSFTLNPGGGEFYGIGFRCQISACDDIEDLAKLRAAQSKLPPTTMRYTPKDRPWMCRACIRVCDNARLKNQWTAYCSQCGASLGVVDGGWEVVERAA